MIKKLQTKFICIVMTITVLMVAGILAVVMRSTAYNLETQSIHMMRSIAASPFQQGHLGRPSDNEVRLPFFVVQISSFGELITASGGYFDLSDREHIQQIIYTALHSDAEIGEIKDEGLRFLKANTQLGFTIVFADTTAETGMIQKMLHICLAILAASILVFFGISIVLSRWATKPAATAWEQQRQFVADASHELKTPLAVIMSNAELMSNEEMTGEEQKTYSNNILTTAYQMRSLVENMLEMARVDNGSANMNFADVDFSQLVSDAVLSFQMLYEEKQLGLRCAIQGEIVLRGSEQHLFQVLDVLLDNALKYSTQNGMVSVNLSKSGRCCILSVSSPGEQLSGEELKNIFKRFYRADKARARNGSYGLGLAIAQSIVEVHKGKIWAESINGYNTFYVQLPSV